MAKVKPKITSSATAAVASKPFYFLSYSTAEPQIKLFTECLQIVFKKHFELKQTPASLAAGESQHETIIKQIKSCEFGVVCLDGLRPNVVYEYGALRGANRPILIFRETSAEVDIKHLYGNTAGLAIPPHPPIELDRQFSDTKDVFYETWNRFEIKETVKKIWQAYDKARAGIESNIKVPEPNL